MQKKKKNESEALYGELGKAFNFTQGDLEANRAGFMSWRQQEKIRRQLLPSLIFVILAIISLFPLLAFLWSLTYLPSDKLTVWTGITFFLMAIPAFVFIPIGIQYLINSLLQLSRRRLSKYEGNIKLSVETIDNSDYFKLRFENYEISLEQSQFMALNFARSYKIYYLPEDSSILSIE